MDSHVAEEANARQAPPPALGTGQARVVTHSRVGPASRIMSSRPAGLTSDYNLILTKCNRNPQFSDSSVVVLIRYRKERNGSLKVDKRLTFKQRRSVSIPMAIEPSLNTETTCPVKLDPRLKFQKI